MKKPEENTLEQAATRLFASFDARKSRRSLLKGAAVAGAAGITAVGAGALFLSRGSVAHASGGEGPEDSIVQILSVAATAEELAVTFYSNAIANANALGISGVNLAYLHAAVVEEQLHHDFLVAAGGTPLTSTFSFPSGGETFTNISTFISTLDQLETAFEQAYCAAVLEFAEYGQPRLAQIAAQIGMIEGEHRSLGISIPSTVFVPNNHAYVPPPFESLGDAAEALVALGYLSPKSGNSYAYQAVSTVYPSVVYRQPFAASEDND